ncbi:MAG: hypothetical protein E7277_05475 [Lachnospiraceae bacterium]|jgi:hypothetical protein|nr:hypothetical protein [Lachnospiraceae bacterium]
MASFYGISSDSVSTLFSSIGKGSSTGSILADYASIKNGSYYKLARKYYGGQTPSVNTTPDAKKVTKTNYEKTHEVGKKQTAETTTGSKKTNAKAQEYNDIKSGADSLVKAADTLLTRGSASVFAEKSVTDKDGKITKQVDKEAIYKDVSSFVESYNKTLDNSKKSSIASIKTARNTMVNSTIANKRKLAEVGITIDKDNKMTIDKDAFENADVSKVKSLFNDRNSYAAGIKTNASYMSMSAKNAATQNSLYASSGMYNNYNQIPAFEDAF